MDRFRGFTRDNVFRVKNTNGNHDEIAADLSMVLNTPCYAPWTESGAEVKFRVIRVNDVDNSASGVMYSAIQDISHSAQPEFWYFHTAKSPLKEGQIIKSGDLVCYTAVNGVMTGPHLHLEGREGTKHLNPNDCMALMKGGKNGILLGFPKVETCEEKLNKTLQLLAVATKQIEQLKSDLAIANKKLEDIKKIIG